MAKWSVTAAVHGSKHLGVIEAATADESVNLALQQNGSVNLCHHCVSECEDPVIGECIAEEVPDAR